MISDLNSAVPALDGQMFDVCVCGTGPAGMTVARKLAAKGKSVVLVEAGGLEYSEQSQRFYAGMQTGLKMYDPLVNCRLRYFGGTSNHWSGRCSLFDPVDFDTRPYHGMSGWPISREEVLAHLSEAREILDLGDQDLERKGIVFSQVKFEHAGRALSSPTRFGPKYLQEIAGSDRIHLLFNANVTDIRLSPVASLPDAEHVVATSYRGQTVRIRAKRYVLALGAIENARLLLNCNSQLPAGIGNHSGYVGACFMEHFNVEFGRFAVRQPAFFGDAAYFRDGRTQLSPRPSLQRAKHIGNAVLALDPGVRVIDYGRLRSVKAAVRSAACGSDTVRDFARRFVEFKCHGDGVITSIVEQSPSRASKVFLDSEEDEFGLRRARLDWVLNEFDRKTIRALGLELAKSMARMDVARVQLREFVLDPEAEIETSYHCHHMGTTRMSKAAKDGVCDENARIHGVRNLYVAGASLFPTGGGCNPTLTVVLLALRLGEHLGALE